MNAPIKPRRVPAQKPGRSVQDVRSPEAFLAAIAERFGPIRFDLAATAENAVAPDFFTPEQDALKQEWRRVLGRKLAYLNPPFARLEPWVRKCAEEGAPGARILLLTPASVGSEWFAEHVLPNAVVLALRPRLVFRGHKASYPKDLVLSVFGTGVTGFSTWRWKP